MTCFYQGPAGPPGLPGEPGSPGLRVSTALFMLDWILIQITVKPLYKNGISVENAFTSVIFVFRLI